MPMIRWFEPGKPVNRRYDPTTLTLACLCAATARVALDVFFRWQPALLPDWFERVLGGAAVAVPIFAAARLTRGIDTMWSVFLGSVAMSFASAVFVAEHAVAFWLRSLGAPDTGLRDPVWGLVVAIPLLAIAFRLTVTGFIAAMIQATWEIRRLTAPPRLKLPALLLDAGASCVLSYSVWFLAIPLAIFSPGLTRPVATAAVLLLFLPTIWTLSWRALHPLARMPADLSPADAQRWLCAELFVEHTPVKPTANVYVTRGVWWGDPLVIAHVGVPRASQWMVCCGQGLWDKKAWAVPASVFMRLRPDLVPLLGLPPGWVATTDSADVRYDPALAERVAKAMERCAVFSLPYDERKNAQPLVV
jgi:hypothetical protein